MSDKPLILVDGSSYLFRAFHALPPLTNSRGEATGAVFGVVKMLRKLLDEYQPDAIAVVFDAKGKTFRDELFAEYKANRPSMPDDLREQIEPLHQAVRGMGLPLLVVPGVEADDVIGTLAVQGAAAGRRVLISTGDKDMAQLVNDQVEIIDTMFNKHYDHDGVVAKFGVPPARIIEWLALVGDTSDNIPGVPKVGPKTATKWLGEYGDLDTVIANAESIKGKIGEYLRENLDQLALSRQLATIKCDVELELSIEQLQIGPRDLPLLREVFERIESKALLSEVLAAQQVDAAEATVTEVAAVETRYEVIFTQAALDAWLERLQAAKLFAFDTETTSLNYMQAEIVGVSFAIEPGEAAYVPLAHDYPGAPEQLSLEAVLAQLRPLLESGEHAKVGQHLKYDAHVLENHGIALRGIAHDTMLESYIFDSTGSRHDMDSLALKYLARNTVHFEDIAGKGAKQLTFNQVDVETAGNYAAEDADITLQLHLALWPKLQALDGQASVYQRIELPLVPVLQRVEHAGVLVDVDMLHELTASLAQRLVELESAAHDCAGKVFKLGSPKQLAEILFEELQLPVKRKTPKGAPSTAEDVLEELATEHELPRLILDHRAAAKLKSTYTEKLPEQVNPATGRVHTSYHQAVAATGRLSSSDPNLQNIPIRRPEGRQIRQAFIAPQGHKLLAADYSQIELRIMAHLSGDAGLLQAFQAGEDVHRVTAAEVFGTQLEAVSDEQRRAAKAINFGLIYGMSAFGLAKQLHIERGAAADYIERYFSRYPMVRDYMDRTRELAHENGYVETLFGRRLYLPEINSRNAQRRQYAERTANNAPMQGTAADIIKRAMLAVDDWLQEDKPGARIIMQVHDELVLEVAEDQLAPVQAGLRERMENAATLDVPLLVDMGIGKNWDEAH